jgi:multicomponent Na+:H+ antiporter subunit G
MADLGAVLLIVGAAFLLLAAIGIVRMPDLFMRMQAASKASTLGVGFLVLAAGVYFGDLAIMIRVLLVIAFLFLTAPVAAHIIARSAYFVGVPLWEHTRVDELRGHYDRGTHVLFRPDKKPALPEDAAPSDDDAAADEQILREEPTPPKRPEPS